MFVWYRIYLAELVFHYITKRVRHQGNKNGAQIKHIENC